MTQDTPAARFTKKPVTIDAIRWTGDNIKAVMDFMEWRNASHDERTGLLIHTLEGNLSANVGDWIIKGVKGEFYACKPDIFEATYNPESSTQAATSAAGGATGDQVRDAIHWIDDFIARCNGDDRGACESVNIVRRALAAKSPDSGAGPDEPQQVFVDFEQIGTAGPFPVVGGRVKLPAITMADLAQMLKPTYEAALAQQGDQNG